ncbi:MAG: methionine--tRNA ligase [Acidobacteria bacterium]|nr:MAG: methionine--tRNA ligase [Acidobacteriota bacterium]REK01543.1 MAG: methionine--tRNA ligase [Acidobacteriota bacterium]REK14499.1 MAG: methionine--tRNA ligase [Acidobacteriota bacterium]REK45214.1 MAG: methionine--tRNA ligase [Acidobacteriota bacterium]
MTPFYITTPIYYANSLPHLGHLYTTTVADAVRRYKRQRGFDTYFLTGTDEHGINIQRAAEANGRTPKEQVDFIADEIKKLFADFELDPTHGGYDIFMRTTNEFHYAAVQKLWLKIADSTTPKDNEAIYKGFYEAWFCAACAEFKTETEYEIRDGEEIPRCLVHEKPLDRVEEESYFFRLSDYEDALLDAIQSNPNLIRPVARRNEIVSFIKSGLQDLSISREKKAVSWGVPVPGDDGHVMYVWMDALSNYITAIGYGDPGRTDNFEKYWSNAYHFIGKDILRFHSVYWFSFLMAAGIDLPKTVYAHGMWLDADGRKMGKTLGNVIEPSMLKEHYYVEGVRYFVLREMVFGQDSRFGYDSLADRLNADLAKGLGNLSARTLSMIHKYREGKVPSGVIHESKFIFAKRAGLSPDEAELVAVIELARDEFLRKFDDFEFSGALEAVWRIISFVDKMITHTAPWKLVKDDDQQETLNAVLYRSIETLRWLGVILNPVMPEATKEIWKQLGLEREPAEFDPSELKWGGIAEGHKVGKSEPVFPMLDKEKIMSEIEAAKKAPEPKRENKQEPAPEDDGFISIEDFVKVELRAAEILKAERVDGSDKLLRFEVDVGEDEPRQVLAGIAQHYDPESLVGTKVVVVSNLKPRKLFGLESQGMVCAASDPESGKPVLATFSEDIANGTRLK